MDKVITADKSINAERIIKHTRNWLDSVVIELNLCPFAKKEVVNNRIEYIIEDSSLTRKQLETLAFACQQLDAETEKLETCLLIYPCGLEDFESYLDFLELAEQILDQLNYTGIYQLASFHPEYQFSETQLDDPANYTNRSPYPMLHLLRENSLEKAIAVFPNPENIPPRNIKKLRELGIESMREKLEHCKI